MSKSLKQQQDELFEGLEDILPTEKELNYETRGKKQSSTRLNWTEEQRATKYHSLSEETRAKLSAANKGRKTKPMSEETRKKLSEANKGKKRSKPFTEETRKKMSESSKGKIFTEETRKKMSESRKGRIVTEETRKKLSEANLKNGHRPPVSNPKGSKRDPSISKKLMKPVKTKFGVYHSVTDAILGYKQAGILNAGQKLRSHLKEGKEECFYISKEEYTRLTGKEL